MFNAQYIGITGFMNRGEVEEILKCLPLGCNRKLMVGVLASLKTWRGQVNKWPNRYPKIGFVHEIFFNHPQLFNVVHYNTKEPETLREQLLQLTNVIGPDLHGFQLNIAWPNPQQLASYYVAYPGTKIILQIGGYAFELIEHSPQKLASRVAQEYSGLIDYILLDPSGGFGKPLNTAGIRNYLRALKEKGLKVDLGVAGGLGPRTLNLVEPLIEEFPDLSIDVESGVRDSEDNLDLNLAKEYLNNSLNLFASKNLVA